MTKVELLEEVKSRLGITGDFHDKLLSGLIDDVISFLSNGGAVKLKVSTCVGVIARGVADLWNYGAGDGQFSDIFYKLAIQAILL